MHTNKSPLVLLTLMSGFFLHAEQPVTVSFERNPKGGYELYADNAFLVPCFLELTFTKLDNLTPSRDAPYQTALPPASKKIFLFSINPTAGGKTAFNYNFNFSKGDPLTAKHDDNYLYLFPFAHGVKFMINQGYNGATTHKDSIRYALDFSMDTGTPVYAAREGLVEDVKKDSDTGGVGEQFKDTGNYVEIYHDDGSFAIYMHLRLNGAVVKTGDTVEAGQLLGYSGNTGYSSGPHLHFAVSIPTLKGMESIPTRFLNYNGEAVTAEPGNYYYSTHPGQPPFTVELGQLISDADYASYAERIPQNDKIEIRARKVDTKVLVFVRNGFKKAKQVTVNFTLTNMRASKTIPSVIKVPALTENFLLILESVKAVETCNYNYTYNWKDAK